MSNNNNNTIEPRHNYVEYDVHEISPNYPNLILKIELQTSISMCPSEMYIIKTNKKMLWLDDIKNILIIDPNMTENLYAKIVNMLLLKGQGVFNNNIILYDSDYGISDLSILITNKL